MATTDPHIFVHGHFLVNLIQQPGPMPTAMLERICARLTEATHGAVRFDWHKIGGRPMLLYLGDYDVAKAAYLAEGAYIREEADAYARAWDAANPDMLKSCGPTGASNLGMLPPDGPDIAGPGMITMGQVYHRERIAREHGIELTEDEEEEDT